MKNLLIYLISIGIVSCTSTNESERIDDFSNQIKFHYEHEIESSLAEVENSLYDKFEVKKKLLALDSLTKMSLELLDLVDSKEEARKILDNWRSDVSQQTSEKVSSLNIDRLLGDSFYLSNVRYEILFQARHQLNWIVGLIGAQEIRFDKVNSLIIPNSNEVNIGERYKAQIILASYSSNIDEILEIHVDGKPILIEEGIGYMEFTPTTRGKKHYTVDFIGTKNDQFLKPYDLKKKVEYVVK